MIYSDDETIIAQCTPQGSGAIALLRISGSTAVTIACALAELPGNKKLSEQETHTVHYGWVIDKLGNHIDQVMFIVMRAPRTFTGQDVVEITCHNNPFLIDLIIHEALLRGARLAQPGEFTRRAFSNGKIDLVQAESINELIHAQTQMALKKALAQLEGSFSHWIARIEKSLITILAWCEASFEFLDEERDFGEHIKNTIAQVLTNIATCKKVFDAQQNIRNGIRIALIGSVNAGKSSLFNALLQQKRAIVAPIAGTTRDSIEAGLYRNGNYWTLIDTAGLRQTADTIEQEGIKRSLEEAQRADIILFVVDSSQALTVTEQDVYQKISTDFAHKIIMVNNKIDLVVPNPTHHYQTNTVNVSALTGYNCAALETEIEAKITQLFAQIESPFLLNQRQHNLLIGLENKLIIIQGMLADTVHYELISYHLRDALEQISELTGKTISEGAIDMVFKEFCVGK